MTRHDVVPVVAMVMVVVEVVTVIGGGKCGGVLGTDRQSWVEALFPATLQVQFAR